MENGDFEEPRVCSIWQYFYGGIPHWTSRVAQVGDCNAAYNSNWPLSSGQCIELDSDANVAYTQVITISQKQFN